MKNYLGYSSFQTHWNPITKCVEYSAQPRRNWQCTQTGTGITGVTSWVPTEGVVMQLGHTDAWDSEGELPSLLRVSIEPEGDPFYAPLAFSGGLDTRNGRITWKAETKDGAVTVRIVPDMIRNMIMVEVEDGRREPGNLLVRVEPHRTNADITGDHGTCFCIRKNRPSGIFNAVNEANGVVNAAGPDLLSGRAAVVAVRMEEGGTRSGGEALVRSQSPRRMTHILIAASTGLKTGDEIRQDMFRRLEESQVIPFADREGESERWWKSFWQRSYFEIAKDSPLNGLSMVWYTSRFFAATTMRGQFIPKFNGSIFLYGLDKRGWGGQYWQQNTRLQYWPLFKTGDIEFLPQYFRMFSNAVPYNRERVRAAYGHSGVIFCETAFLWGGVDPHSVKDRVPCGEYTKNHFTGSLELLMMMAEYYRYTSDDGFARENLIPLGEEIMEFFLAHYPIRDGRLFIHNGSALETWWYADEPADIIAGLRAVTPILVRLAGKLGYQTKFAGRMMQVLPVFHFGQMTVGNAHWNEMSWNQPLPGKAILPITSTTHPRRQNFEDPELYAVFPYGLYSVGMPDLECGRQTYQNRLQKENPFGWCQHAIFAARLGIANEAVDRFFTTYDKNTGLCGGMMSSVTSMIDQQECIPDCCGMDTTGALAIAVNEMLMQDHSGRILRRPAWPETEAVAYKLQAAGGVVEEEYKGHPS